MRILKPLATTALSFAFLTAGALAQNPQSTTNTHSDTQSTTATDQTGQTQTTTEHHAKKSQQTTLPDGTVVTKEHTQNSTGYDSNGNAIAPGTAAASGEHSTTNSQTTTTPDGQSQTNTQSHSSSTTTTNPPL